MDDVSWQAAADGRYWIDVNIAAQPLRVMIDLVRDTNGVLTLFRRRRKSASLTQADLARRGGSGPNAQSPGKRKIHPRCGYRRQNHSRAGACGGESQPVAACWRTLDITVGMIPPRKVKCPLFARKNSMRLVLSGLSPFCPWRSLSRVIVSRFGNVGLAAGSGASRENLMDAQSLILVAGLGGWIGRFSGPAAPADLAAGFR